MIRKGTLLRDLYAVEEKLGEGGMAWVYRARHTKLGHEVAIKLLYPHLAGDLSIRERFMSEAQIQSKINHPNIARVVDMIEEKGTFGFVMEWCNAGDLRDWMREERRSPTPAQWRALFLPIVEAMSFSHEEGYVHRDLKPSNILLERIQGRLVPKVSDFGIAKILGVTGRTRTGSLMGTLSYMSPEQVEDSKQIDLRSDIYSLGVMMYELATGRLPFEETGPSVVLQIFRDPPAKPIEAPKSLQPVIMRCLEKDPNARYQDGKALRDAIADALSARHTKRWSHVDYPASMWERRVPSDMESAVQEPPKDALALTVSTAFGEELPDSVVASKKHLAMAETDEAAVADLVSSLHQASRRVRAEKAPTQTERPALDTMEATAKDTPVAQLTRGVADSRGANPSRLRLNLTILLVLFLLGVASAALWVLDPLDWNDKGASTADASARRQPPVSKRRGVARASHTPPSGRILTPPSPRRGSLRVSPPAVRQPGGRPPFATRRSALRAVGPNARTTVPTRRNTRDAGPQDKVPPVPLGPCPEKSRALCSLWRACRSETTPKAGKACVSLGLRFAHGKGAPKDQKRAALYYAAGCRRKNLSACTNLGFLFGRGRGVKLDYARAHDLYQKACEGGYMRGCSNRAVLFARGKGTRVSFKRANALYRKACNGKYAYACLYLGFNVANGRGLAKDKKRAVGLFVRSCQLGNARACWWAGRYLSSGWGVKIAHKRANKLFAKACQRKLGQGCRFLGISYEQGRALRPNMSRANHFYRLADKYLRRSCQKRGGVHCYWAGLAYAEGRGVQHNCHIARRYYRKACTSGYKGSCRLRCVSHHGSHHGNPQDLFPSTPEPFLDQEP